MIGSNAQNEHAETVRPDGPGPVKSPGSESRQASASDSGQACQSGHPAGPPPWLPRHPEFFWAPAPGLERESLAVDPHARSALEALGPPPFEKSGFPLIGLLATVYDHVAEHAGSSQGQC